MFGLRDHYRTRNATLQIRCFRFNEIFFISFNLTSEHLKLTSRLKVVKECAIEEGSLTNAKLQAICKGEDNRCFVFIVTNAELNLVNEE